MFKNKTLLITGGTGSFGHVVLERFLHSEIKEIRIFSRDEKKQDDMQKQYADGRISYILGDVRDMSTLLPAVDGVDYIFHAAALKQVPSCESHPLEAVKTNILGTDHVLSAGIQAGVKKIVCLSTDKAAYPINAMGMSKALMEKTFIAKSRQANARGTIICGTRYGNVMASRGSIIPLLIEQVKEGKPLTVTHPLMTRFMMSLDEAVELVLYAFENACNGDIMVQKSPAAYITDLAQAIKELFHVNLPLELIGTRPGEKLYEVLLTKEEAAKAIDLEGFYRIPRDTRIGTDTNSVEEYHSNNTYRLSIAELKEKLQSLSYVQKELKKWKRLN